MPPLLLVEGLTDVRLFAKLKSFYHSLPYESQDIRHYRGKPEFANTLKAIWDPRGASIIVTRDLNNETPEAVRNWVSNILREIVGVSPTLLGQGRFRCGETEVQVIPVGLFADQSLRGLGLTSHSMEDYLIKLLLEDTELASKILKSRAVEALQFQALLEQLLNGVRNAGLTLDSSKQAFLLCRSLLELYSDSGAAEDILENASQDMRDKIFSPLVAEFLAGS